MGKTQWLSSLAQAGPQQESVFLMAKAGSPGSPTSVREAAKVTAQTHPESGCAVC